ncbi:hypothetical protein H0H81_010233 [Sphagnurus paluster]|uniref:RBR-type E3 ubiquitin transferase n=1 Tax=Sphagnurus paluster TaxID=117069 RepID=A0A9P7KJS5_9AGAR|nr:hypothetical protein H0H81_010233 [Sphagnurus paluster]
MPGAHTMNPVGPAQHNTTPRTVDDLGRLSPTRLNHFEHQPLLPGERGFSTGEATQNELQTVDSRQCVTGSIAKRLISDDARSNPSIAYRKLPDYIPSSTLRYDPGRGILSYTESDSGQTSDSSQYYTATSSPSASESSLPPASKDIEAARTGPPLSKNYLCRDWLMRLCFRGYRCTYLHGDLKYDPPPFEIRFTKDNSPPILERPETVEVGTPVQNIEKKYLPPKSAHFCREWLVNRCFHGAECPYFHGDVDYDPPVKGIHPPPRYPFTCKAWKNRQCFLGYACNFVHEDLEYDDPDQEPPKLPQDVVDGGRELRGLVIPTGIPAGQDQYSPYHIPDVPTSACDGNKGGRTAIEATLIDEGVNDPPVGMRPPPKSSETCIQWLRGRCQARYKCKYRHDDLIYDSLEDDRHVADNAPPSHPTHDNVRPNPTRLQDPKPNTSFAQLPMETRVWTVKVHDHNKVKIGPGFDIQGLQTGFETPWIYLGKIPSHVTTDEINRLLRPFGEILDIKIPAQTNNPSMLVRAKFSSSEAARRASTSLNSTQAFGCKISARLPIHSVSHNDSLLENTSVRIKWEAPSKVAYCGYSTRERANEAIAASRKPFRDRFLHSTIHVGLPVVGVVTVRFRGVPLDVTTEDMAWFAKPDDVVWARPNYLNLDYAAKSIKRILEEDTELVNFVVLPPPYKGGGLVQAWASFNTPTEARTACGRLNGRKPVFTGKTRIHAQYIQSLTFTVAPTTFDKISSDIDTLSRTAYYTHRADVSIIRRPPPQAMLIKVSGDDLKAVGRIKLELENILNWETVRHGANVAWDPFFAHPAGQSFLQAIEQETPAVTIRVDITRRSISLLGCSQPRTQVRNRILDKVDQLRAQKIHTIPIEWWLLGIFINNDLGQLQTQLGRENVDLDLQNRRLIIRGSETRHQMARDAVAHARQAHRHPAPRRNIVECPVCFDEVTDRITLPCGHAWCRACLSRYLISSIDNKYFPLTCLGNNAKCSEHIPLQIARMLLTASEFDTIVDAAFAAHIQSHADEFHYCPTPDCMQIYRPAPRDTVLQCPSCLLRICPSCHVEAHDGFSCPDPEVDNNLFREWMRRNDVKPCPGCNIPIERAEGCNHMTCTQCKTHICWVCLQTFPKGDGIYDHMRAKHGGIGLLDD